MKLETSPSPKSTGTGSQGPLLVTSTLVYLCAFVTCIPMNNAMKSSALHTWFSERRPLAFASTFLLESPCDLLPQIAQAVGLSCSLPGEECLVPRHLVLTILMLHESEASLQNVFHLPECLSPK